jgi:hypothetical protein
VPAATGTATCPFTTITAALNYAAAIQADAGTVGDAGPPAVTIHVAAGTYTAAGGETFPLQVRGVSLVGAGAASTIVQGEGVYDHSAQGGQFPANNLNITLLIGAHNAPTTISGITAKPLVVSPNAGDETHLAVDCDRGNITTQGYLAQAQVPAPNTLLKDVVVESGYMRPVIVTNTVPPTGTLPYQSGCNIKVTGSTVKGGPTIGIWALGAGRTNYNAYTVALAFGDDNAAQNVLSGFTDPSGTAYGIVAWDGTASLVIANSTFSGNQYGASLTQHQYPDAGAPFNYFEVRSSTFTGNTVRGFEINNAARLARFTNNTFTGNTNASGSAAAVSIDMGGATPSSVNGPGILYARGNKLIGNDNGLVFTNSNPSLGIDYAEDWGTATDPGKNEFRCNSALSDAGAAGHDFIVQPTAAVQISLVGNSWDQAPPNTVGISDGGNSPNGTDLTYTAGSTAPNAGNATVATDPCPVGRVP